MLPKVASHILHHTSRAVTAVQNQTGYTIRNVLQLQTQSSSPAASSANGLGIWNGAGSSSWGSSGAGPGGAKFNAGSRFYNGYTGAGRAVTQANSSTATDSTNTQSDDNDDLTAHRISLQHTHKTRARSHSLSVGGRHERGEQLGVLKTVQMHARSSHAFAITPPTDPPLPKSTKEPDLGHQEHTPTDLYLQLKAARDSKDATLVLSLVQSMRAGPELPHVAEFNMALEALHQTRRPGEPLNILLDTYNEMIKRSIVPNTRTYLILILALTDRDHEIHRAIIALETRSKRRHGTEPIASLPDQQRIEQLRSENTFGSAMSLFEAATVIAWNKTIIPLTVYSNLLRSCAYHSNVDGAIHVFAHLERRSDLVPSASIYSHLISVYTNIGDLEGAKEVFKEYRNAAKSNRISWHRAAVDSTTGSDTTFTLAARTSHLIVWNKMIEAHFRCGDYVGGLTLLEQMMDSKASDEFKPDEIPPPASSTFTQIIAGFCQAGDVSSALSWFNRLLQQDATARHPHESSLIPPRPDQVAWMIMMEKLASENMVPELNELFTTLMQNASRDGLEVRGTDRVMVYEANLRYLNNNKTISNADAIQIIDFLVQHVLNNESNSSSKIHRKGKQHMVDQIAERYLRYGDPIRAFNLLEPFIKSQLEHLRYAESLSQMKPASIHQAMQELRDILKSVGTQALQADIVRDLPISFTDVMRIVRLSDATGFSLSAAVAPGILFAYSVAKAQGDAFNLSIRDWELLFYATTAVELSNNNSLKTPDSQVNTTALLEDLQKNHVSLNEFDKTIIRRIVKAIFLTHGIKELQDLFARLGPDYERILNNPERDSESLRARIHHNHKPISPDVIQAVKKPINVDIYHSRYVEEFFPNHPTISPLLGYSRFEGGVQKGTYPTPSTIGRLINALGRLKEMDKVRKLYDAAQLIISTLESESHWQSNAWFLIENQMVIACAHAGEMDAAFEHRDRITAQGGTPSADAYGALVECVKDTTDDTSNAMSIYQESQALGCIPNIYLYNTTISKLAKARKADHALELFQQMKASGVIPSSITYGAIISACARVGDAMSAEQLFIEMSQQRNFKPRIPPFNTMMQLYTQTKPNRERVLHYHQAMLNARIPPTGHTYKLLLDAYGTIEPVDTKAMEVVFRELEANQRVPIQGTHWASIINAWGCVQKDLDKAIAIFDSIPTHSSTVQSPGPMPDAVAYEALINVLVTHRQMDLVPPYIERLLTSGIHMTAYIANLLIKGHAAVGDIAQARTIFESLEDPPQGVAAVSNHVPHPPSPSSPMAARAPCHREPSTWEAMFRAELGSGNRENALVLLERLRARHYPPAVYNRISGIMLDDSVSPWPTS